MCGICGFIGLGDISDLKKMNDMMIHRGPEEEGLWQDPLAPVYLGHRRLSIIDISTGNQPMFSHDKKYCIVFNGEIYNHAELKTELVQKGHVFQTDHSDTEVLINGYREWRDDLPNHLNGMWAFALYDLIEKKIFISRDRFGKKPLFYSFQKNNFFFASELSALIQHYCVNANLSTRSLKKYFAYGYIPAPNSLYENIFKLPGGCNLKIDVRTLKYEIKKYWEFVIEPFNKIPNNPEEVWGEELRHLLDQAVKRRLIADVPLGIFLSGGIDSSSIAAYASKYVSKRIKTFSIGFDSPTFDETYYSDLMSKELGTDHFKSMLTIDNAKEILPDILGKLDEPMGDCSLLPTYLLCRETKKEVTVALGGDGADELFAGYDTFKALKLANFYNRTIPKPVHAAICYLAGHIPVSHINLSFDFRLNRTLRGLSYPKKLWLSTWMGSLSPKDIKSLFEEPIEMEDLYSEAIDAWDGCMQKNIFDKTLVYYTKLFLQDDILVKVDRASMMNTLEVRVPFLDIDLVNFARKIPWQYKYRNGITKYILKKALEPILPKQILYRPKKGFGVPIGQWYKDRVLNIDTSKNIKTLSQTFMIKQLNNHLNGENDNRAYLWNHWILINMKLLKKI